MKAVISEIRWIARSDLQAVVDIESRSFADPWTQDDFITLFRKPNGIGMLIEHDDQIVGYTAYMLLPDRIYLCNLAIDPKYRGMGLGKKLVDRLKSKLATNRRNRITTHVNERNVNAQCFLRQCGFRCERVEKNMYDDTTLDAYMMVYWLDQ